ncbi:MAG: endonuclease V [Candidatus Aenigmarchaeota archaeon]|nr:endonuclease V [Candidatus Aenigmarchaeota archaeon]
MIDFIGEQERLSRKVILEDNFDELNTVAGASIRSVGNKIYSSIVVCDYSSMDVIDFSLSMKTTDFPYISGLQFYREGPSIISSFKKLKSAPNLLLLKSSGICHPRFFGMASQIGVVLDIPTIGITKNLLCGHVKGDKIIYGGRQVGWKLGNIYVSPGHMVSLDSSLRIVKNCMKGHRLPEPIYLAQKILREHIFNKN